MIDITCLILVVPFILYIVLCSVNLINGFVLRRHISKYENDTLSRVVFVTDLQPNLSTTFWKLFKHVINLHNNIVNYVETLFKLKQYVFDINDSNSIIQIIQESDHNKKNIIMFIESDGGFVEESDAITNAIQVYQHNNHDSGKKLSVIVIKQALSAATVLALSSDNLYMDSYAVLGPTDPQSNFGLSGDEIDDVSDVNDDGFITSCGFFKDILQTDNEIINISSLYDYVIVKDNIQSHNDNITMFKKLSQYRNSSDENKADIIKMFCECTVPHHRAINTVDLRNIGLNVNDVTDNQRSIYDIFKVYQKYC